MYSNSCYHKWIKDVIILYNYTYVYGVQYYSSTNLAVIDREAIQKLEAHVRAVRTSCGEKVSRRTESCSTCTCTHILWGVLCRLIKQF